MGVGSLYHRTEKQPWGSGFCPGKTVRRLGNVVGAEYDSSLTGRHEGALGKCLGHPFAAVGGLPDRMIGGPADARPPNGLRAGKGGDWAPDVRRVEGVGSLHR